MAKEWAPSWWGRTLTGSPEWRLQLAGLELTLTVEGQAHRIQVEDEAAYQITRGTFWTDLVVLPGTSGAVRVDGLPNADGDTLSCAVEQCLVDKRLREDVAFVQREHESMGGWLRKVAQLNRSAKEKQLWVTHEQQVALNALRPTVDTSGMRERLAKPPVRARLGDQLTNIESFLGAWDADWSDYWARFNQQHTERELAACKALFDQVEKQPLTKEQAQAVVCFDNRVQVVASAGSGKTSTMVAKAAYAIHRQFVAPDRIVLLAFNKQAAEELKERAAQSFERLNMEGVSVEASTFHALGLSIIGKATGEKPDIPVWAVDPLSGLRKLTELVDQLKDRSPKFRMQWDLFRFVFGRDLPAFGDPGTPDVWDAHGNAGLRTAHGELVKSQEEAMLANWLFMNGVAYHYEGTYEFKTGDEEHRQYKPDFYYPDIQLYHEHFALDAHGRAPAHFTDYEEQVEWKRALHSTMGTELFETTSHGLRNGNDFERLAAELTARGIELDPNPDRPIPTDGQKPIEAKELILLIRTFIGHAKSNCLTIGALHQRLEAMPDTTFKFRHRMFLGLAGPILEAWDKALAAEGGIDFEDMLNQAAEHLELGRYEVPFDLVMADEFQDASRARARLCRAMVQKPGRSFFAVGDDWQSINRFAGADVSVMTGFRKWFGHGQVLKLEQTFRCPQALCDVSSAFVSKNPAQFAKRVRSVTPASGPVLQAFQVSHKDKLADAIDRFVTQLADGVREGSIPPGRNGRVSVFVLGRFNADQQYVPIRRSGLVDVSFLTIHRSKGSEADYVILPRMLSVGRGLSFPDTRADDPVLAMAMPDGDDFPLSEERRLFYVALTRARRSVAMFTVQGRHSHFLTELIEDSVVAVTDVEGEPIEETPCPACRQGVIIVRDGKHGPFEACSNFPDCRYKPRKRYVRSERSFQRPMRQRTH